MQFGELVDGTGAYRTGGTRDMPVQGISYDSRRIKPGDLFVAIKGFKEDGHDYIMEAVKNGAVAVVADREIKVPDGTSWAMADNTRKALALLSSRFYGNPSSRMKLIGVTGTNGKTTTATMIYNILRKAGQKAGLIGTIHNRIDQAILPVSHTTPESKDLQLLMSEMVAAGIDACVMEVSSHALALHRVEGCEFDQAIHTNFSQDHLDFHSDMHEYLQSKLKLFSGLKAPVAKEGNKYAIINADDPKADCFIKAAAGVVRTYGVNLPADVRAGQIITGNRGVEFRINTWLGYSTLIQLKVTGLFNVYNALAAWTSAALMGIEPDIIKTALEEMKGVPGRFELVDAGQDFGVVVDYAHTPDGLVNILKTGRQVAAGRLITVFGCGGDRDRSKRPLMGSIAARYSDHAILTSDNPRTEDPSRIIEDIEAGLDQVAGACSYDIEPDRRRAIRRAIRLAQSGDLVIIAGKGHEDYQIIGTMRQPFDDRLEARAAIEELLCSQ